MREHDLSARGGSSTDSTRPHNNLLRLLRPEDYALLAPDLDLSEQSAGDQLYDVGDNVATVHFPCGPAMVSFLVANEDGRDVETVLVGREGAVGGIVSHGHVPAYCRIMVKYSGSFAHIGIEQLQAAKARSPSLERLFARYADCLLGQVFQSTACNALHRIEQRAAKWILAAMDRAGDHRVPLTHEQLATMLGVGRSYASRVLRTLRIEGILETHRGALVVSDLRALKARSCQCNTAVRDHFDRVLQGLYPRPDGGEANL